MSPRYAATERKWVAQLLARMTPAERTEYEKRCAKAPRHHTHGKFYDGAKAKIAEQVMYDMRKSLGSNPFASPPEQGR